MENRSIISRRRPAVVKVKPILKEAATTLPSLNVSRTMNPPIQVPLFREITTAPSQSDFVRRIQNMKIHTGLIDRAVHIETHHSHLADLLSRLIQSAQSKDNLRTTVFQRILMEIDKLLMEYVEEELRKSREHNDQQMEDLTVAFDQLLRQKEYAYQREILELHDRVNYFQDELTACRKSNEILEQQLANANRVLVERSQEMGHTMKEITELRLEVERLRLDKIERKNICQIHQEVEKHKLINKEILEEFAKIKSERDEFLSELNSSLMKMRHSNLRRNQAIEAELNEVEEYFTL
uniref:Protein Muted homolog n=1 Tax=Angiostrongylus cantonensis TaxID=6313 RepID=A0A158P6Q2_ANGCA